MKGAKGVIISITGGEDMRLMEVDEAASHIKELVDPDANIIWGSAFNNDLGGKIRVSVVATGIEAEVGAQPAPAKVFSFPARQPAVTPPEPEASANDEAPEIDMSRTGSLSTSTTSQPSSTRFGTGAMTILTGVSYWNISHNCLALGWNLR